MSDRYAVVTLDELAKPLDLAIRCDVAGERMQDSRTSQLIFGVPELVAYLSRHCELARCEAEILAETPLSPRMHAGLRA